MSHIKYYRINKNNEVKIMGKVKNVVKKIKEFSFLNYLLNGKMRSITNDIELSRDLISYNKDVIKNAEEMILKTKSIIATLETEIVGKVEKIRRFALVL